MSSGRREDWSQNRIVIGTQQQALMFARLGGRLVFCGWSSVYVLSVFRPGYEWSCFCLDLCCSWNDLVWCWCSVKLFMIKRNTQGLTASARPAPHTSLADRTRPVTHVKAAFLFLSFSSGSRADIVRPRDINP